MNKNLKLYVWDSFNSRGFDGLAFAIARSLEEAQELVEGSSPGPVRYWGEHRVFPIAPIAYSVSGADDC